MSIGIDVSKDKFDAAFYDGKNYKADTETVSFLVSGFERHVQHTIYS